MPTLDRRTVLKSGLIVPAAALAPTLVSAPAEAALTVGATLASGLNYPWGLDFLPDGSALVTERNSGRVLRVNRRGGATVVRTIKGVYNGGGEGGLLGLAMSPNFDKDEWVYAYATTRRDNRVIRMKYDGRKLGPGHLVLGGIPRNVTHNGGGLLFTDYPSLFVTTGDNRHPARAQSKSTRAGKILRLKLDGSAQKGNPFGNRIYSYGHRNPEGIAVDGRGRIWSSELGENTWDELNRIVKGRNYGWARQEGYRQGSRYTNPFVQWHTDECSPSGVAIAKGRAWVGALRGECLWSVDISGAGARRKTRYFHQRFGRIRNVKRAPDGSLWITTSNGDGNDKVIRLDFT